MLRVNQVKKSFGIDTLFHSITFTVQDGERVGLVGPNGCGKTTLMRIITGQEKADAGSVHTVPADLRVGYLAQGMAFDPGDTLGAVITRLEGDIPALSNRLEALAQDYHRLAEDAALQSEYDHILAQIEQAAENAGKAAAVLSALGLSELPPELLVSSLSGGQKTRLALAEVLLSNPRLLLLDEPTNHLDLDMLSWLEDWLLAFPGAVLVVSHDRAFLDRVATSILEMDTVSRTGKRYEGNYTAYLEQKLAERERQWQAYSDQQAEIARLRGSASHVRSLSKFRKGGKADTGDKFARGFFANRGLETMRRAKQIEQRIDRLMNEDHIDKPGRTWQIKMEFDDVPSSGRVVVAFEDLSVGYGDNVLLSDLNQTIRYGDRVALVGRNGAGKTTLLRAIAGKIPALHGAVRLGSNVRAGYMTQEHEHLDPEMNALQTIQSILLKPETEARAFLSMYLFRGDDVFLPVGKLSYGERARLALACLVAQGCNLLLLDEPVNHLDIPSRARFEQAMESFEGTCLAVVHDRYFIEGFATTIWEIRDGKVMENPLEEPVSYEDWEAT